MKKIALYLTLLLTTSSSYAGEQDHFCSLYFHKNAALVRDIEEFKYLAYTDGYMDRNSHARNLGELMKLTKKLLEANRIDYEVVQIVKNSDEIEIFQILPNEKSYFNRQSKELLKKYPGTRLVYDPYTLTLHGADAYYDPKLKLISMAHESVITGRLNSAYLHEIIHAHTDALIAKKKPPLFSGHIKLVEGEYFSKSVHDGYGRRVALDEIKAFSHSVYMANLDLKKALLANDENLTKELLQDLFDSLRFQKKVTTQINAVMLDALTAVEQPSFNFNNVNFSENTAVFKIPSWSRTFDRGNPIYHEIPNGVEVSLPIKAKDLASLKDKLKALIELNSKIIEATDESLKHIRTDHLDRVEMKGSDLEKLLVASRKPRSIVIAHQQASISKK